MATGVLVSSSIQNNELAEERAAIGRALAIFPPGFQAWLWEEQTSMVTHRGLYLAEAESCRVYLGLFGAAYDENTIQEFERARSHAEASGKKRAFLLFTRKSDAQQLTPELRQFLEKVLADGFEIRPFEDSGDLLRQVLTAMREIYQEQTDRWRMPLLPLRKPFLGREDELNDLIGLVASESPVKSLALSGAGENGKKALLRELAYRVRDHFPAGVFWLDTFGLYTYHPERAHHELAMAHPAGRDVFAVQHHVRALDVKAWLEDAPGRGLVLAPDVSHQSALQELKMVMPPQFTLLISTERLKLQESYVVPALSPDDGAAMLKHMLDRDAPGVQFAERGLERIATMLEGNPVYLEMAAVWLGDNGDITDYIAELSRYNTPFDGAFHSYYNLLTPAQQQLFRATGVFAPGDDFSLEALHAVAGEDIAETARREVLPLLHRHETTGNYYQHPMLTQTAQQMLIAQNELATLQKRHFDYYKNQVLPNPEATASIEDLNQYRHAFFLACQQMVDDLLDYTLPACRWLHKVRLYGELGHWLDVILQITKKQYEASKRTGVMWGNGHVFRLLGDLSGPAGIPKTGRELYYMALLHYDKEKNIGGQAHTFKGLGDLSATEFNYRAARDYYFKALLMFEQTGFKLGQANAQQHMGDLSVRDKEYKQAQELYQKSLVLYRELTFELGEANALKGLGFVHEQQDKFEIARQYYNEALVIYEKIDLWLEQAHVLLAQGQLDMLEGRSALARRFFREALRFYQRVGDKYGQAQAFHLMGELGLQQRIINTAGEHLEQARQLYHHMRALEEEATVDQLLAGVRFEQGRRSEAVKLAWQALNQSKDDDLATEARKHLQHIAQDMGREFIQVWKDATRDAEMPRWLNIKKGTATLEAVIEGLQSTVDAAKGDRALTLCHAIENLDKHLTRGLAKDEIDAPRIVAIQLHRTGVLQEIANLPGEDFNGRVRESLLALEGALQYEHNPLEYGQIQQRRIQLLRDMAGLPNENRSERLFQALEGCTDALNKLGQVEPPTPQSQREYAHTQLKRGNLLRELAGLRGQSREKWMYEAIAVYNEVLDRLRDEPSVYATTQVNRSSLLQEIGELPGEDLARRLHQAFSAVAEALKMFGDLKEDSGIRMARRMMVNTRNNILKHEDAEVGLGLEIFNRWWARIVQKPQPEWLTETE